MTDQNCLISTDVLKFEYLTQLLLDSNYIPLVLKLFAHQDVQQVVDSKMDRVENRYVPNKSLAITFSKHDILRGMPLLTCFAQLLPIL